MNVSSVSFYRKYRPQSFADVVGQNHVKETLKNAVAYGRISHAYLFTGPRGIGKTTIARIFAKAVNCKNHKAGEPDNKCESCSDLSSGKSLDLIEIDGASNRGIDEIRELREKIKFAPHISKYKVFIIDEVHMLTKEAFNALLKTLEEPPSHAIFILATTEIHKIPATVISRCQRFNFSRLSLEEIVNKLKRIVEVEKIKTSDESLHMIASYSEGAVRDAESMLDQIASFGNKKITPELIKDMLGIASIETADNLIEAVFNNNAKKSLEIIADVTKEGIDILIFMDTLIEKMRDLLLIKLGNEDKVIFFNEEEGEMLKELAMTTEEERIVNAIEELAEAKQKAKYSNPPHLPLELAVMKMTPGNPGIDPDPIPQKKTEEEIINPEKKKETVKKPEPVVKNEKPVKKAPIQVEDNFSQDELLKNIRSKWHDIVESLKVHNHSIALCLKTAEPDAIENGHLMVGFTFPLHMDKVQELTNKRLVEDSIKTKTGSFLPIRCFIKTKRDKVETRESQDAFEIFGGEIIE